MKQACHIAALLTLCVSPGLRSQTPPKSVGIRVSETAGIRRTAFPVNARVHLPQGVLKTADNARLVFQGKETPAQYSAGSRWQDGSLEWLDVDYNASIGPNESQSYQLEFGDGVKAAETPRGLVVSEDAEIIQVGNVRFSRSGNPLMASVKYRGEEIGRGLNGLSVTDDAGQRRDLSNVESLKTEVPKRGPLYVAIRYSGNIRIDSAYSVPFAIMIEMPNSKTMVKIAASIDDPARRLREISIQTPLTFGPLPWVWDFGTARWTYGSLRNAADSVTMTQAAPNEWNVVTGPKGKEQLYETLRGDHTELVRWGHIQDGKEVVAYAVDAPETGTRRITLDGDGQVSFRYAPATPGTQLRLTIYEHFVTTPVQIGAATSPSAILSPLAVAVDAVR